MARYTTGQTLAGLSTIILDNLWQDDALIRERLAFTLFEKMGQPAPRESFCRLFINNEYQGLYTITEEIDGDFAKRVTGETDGTVFEFHYLFRWNAEDLGAIASYKPLFEPRTHVLDADTTLYTPIQQLFKEVNGPDDAVWRQRVEQYIDLNQFMTHVAIETFVADNDAILGAFGMNNFYLYRFQGTTRHRLFVWDKDNAFQFLDSPIPTATTVDNVLFKRAMTQPDLRETYLKALEDCATISATDNFLAFEVDRLVAIVFDAAKGDTRKQFDRFDDAVQFLRDFAAARPAQVLADVARIRRTGS
jgi:hypothetical protein